MRNEPAGTYWMGVFELKGGAGNVGHDLIVHLKVRNGVTKGDALRVCRLGIRDLAEANSLEGELHKVTLSYEDESGRESPPEPFGGGS